MKFFNHLNSKNHGYNYGIHNITLPICSHTYSQHLEKTAFVT